MQRPIRTMLYVPAHKQQWVDNVPVFGADATVLDLEDSVPHHLKTHARGIVAAAIPRLAGCGTRLYVRTNKGRYSYDAADLEAVVQPGLNGIIATKVEDLADIETISRLIAEIEHGKGMPVGGVTLIPPVETAGMSRDLYKIAAHPRVETIAAVSAKGADLERALGFIWTPDGLETLYHRSRAVLAVKAAGKRFAIGGMWQDVHDHEGMRKQARFNKQLGFAGEIILHPGSVPVINEVYSPTAEELDFYRGLIAAFEAVEKEGEGALMYRGEHIDIAHVETARGFLELWER